MLFPHQYQMILLSFVIYSMLVFNYVIGIFGLLESSLRIKILDVLAVQGENGMSRRGLLRIYNKDTIVKKRVKRLISSGELAYTNGMYHINKRISFVYIPYYIVKMMFYLYKGTSI
jgi:hypothetical protein